jgi:ubiquinone/menaquinone biosynthesis C-methylase UbiE
LDHRQAGRYWERNAAAWTLLSRQGWDIYRDAVNTPAFLELLPDVTGLRGLDIGCGEGHNTRLFARRGARMFAVDISPAFIHFAIQAESDDIQYSVANALELPFAAGQFDFATAVMSLMDLPDQMQAFREIHRVLRPGGFLQFSITHPCFSTPHRRNLRSADGQTYAIEVGRYFERVDGRIDRWTFSAAPEDVKAGLEPFEVPLFHRTLAEWLNTIIQSGLLLERVAEPKADGATVRQVPAVADTQVVAYFLHFLCRKPL